MRCCITIHFSSSAAFCLLPAIVEGEVAADCERLGLLLDLGGALRLAIDPLRTWGICACCFALRTVVFPLPVRAAGARRAVALPPAVRAGGALRALAYNLTVRADGALCAVAFHLAVRAGGAHRAVLFQLAVRAGVARRAEAFQPSVRTRVACRAVIVRPSVLATFHCSRAMTPRGTRFCTHWKVVVGVVAFRCLQEKEIFSDSPKLDEGTLPYFTARFFAVRSNAPDAPAVHEPTRSDAFDGRQTVHLVSASRATFPTVSPTRARTSRPKHLPAKN